MHCMFNTTVKKLMFMLSLFSKIKLKDKVVRFVMLFCCRFFFSFFLLPICSQEVRFRGMPSLVREWCTVAGTEQS